MDIKEAIALVADGENLNMDHAGAAMDDIVLGATIG
jgi:hypothetical protein